MAECKLYKGTIRPDGYGQKCIDYIQYLAHRLAWEEKRGPVPEGMSVLHTCDVRRCVQNDDEGVYVVNGKEFPRQGHLWLGTDQDNVTDMHAKGRGNVGQKNGQAKLTDGNVRLIRTMCAAGHTYRSVAASFGIAHSVVSDIINCHTWTHVQ